MAEQSRRGFLGALIGVSATSITPTPPVLPRVDRAGLDTLNTYLQTASRCAPEILGDWRIFFTGLKASRDNDWLCGQWCAWPNRGPEGPLITTPRYFQAAVPFVRDGDGEYHKGDVFMIGPGIYIGDVVDHQRWPRIALQVDDGRVRLLRILQREGLI